MASRSSPEQTLTSIVMDKILSNLNFYFTHQKTSFSLLPSILKHKLFIKLLRSLMIYECEYFIRKGKFENLLEFFANNITDWIYLEFYVSNQLLEKLTICFPNLKKVVFRRGFPKNMPRGLYDSDSDDEENEASKDMTKLGLMKFLVTTPKLEELVLFHEPKLTDAVLICLAKNCKHVKILDVTGCPVTDRSIAFLRNLNLEKLSLSKTRLTNAGLRILVGGKCGKALKELEIDCCSNVTFHGIKTVANRCALKKFSFREIGEIVSISQLKFKHPPEYAVFSKPEYYDPPSDDDYFDPHDAYVHPVQYVRWNSEKMKWDPSPE